MNKKISLFVLSVIVVGVYLFFTGFGLVKKFVGYNMPEFKEPEAVLVDGGELSFLDIPEGFEISIVAKDLDNPRVILFDPKGRMLISETKAGRVSILEDVDKDGERENKR